MSALLDVRGLSVRFGGVVALNDVDLVVEPGRLAGLIGPNGAGKTTFIDAISGFVRAATGVVRFCDVDVTGLTPTRRARLGLGRTWQSVELFADLSIAENLMIGIEHPMRSTTGGSPSIDDLCELVGVPGVAERFPHELSHGQQKLIGVARALAAQPRLLCLDEPAAGLDTSESAELAERLQRIRADGTAILLVDHDMNLVMNVCDDISVLEFGAVIAHGPPSAVRADAAVIAAYLGTSTSTTPSTAGAIQ